MAMQDRRRHDDEGSRRHLRAHDLVCPLGEADDRVGRRVEAQRLWITARDWQALIRAGRAFGREIDARRLLRQPLLPGWRQREEVDRPEQGECGVSWPAIMKVAIWSRRCSGVNGCPVSGSRAVENIEQVARRVGGRVAAPLGDDALEHPLEGAAGAGGSRGAGRARRARAGSRGRSAVPAASRNPRCRPGCRPRARASAARRRPCRRPRAPGAAWCAGRRAGPGAAQRSPSPGHGRDVPATISRLRGAKAGATSRRWCFQALPSARKRPSPISGCNAQGGGRSAVIGVVVDQHPPDRVGCVEDQAFTAENVPLRIGSS